MKIYTCLCLLFLAGYLVAQNNTSALLPMPNQITPVKGKPFTVRSGKTAIYYKRQNKLFHFHKTFCSEFDIINTKQNVHFTKVVSYLPVLFIFASV